jgi:hypothetical protein
MNTLHKGAKDDDDDNNNNNNNNNNNATQADNKCRLVEHIISACPIIAKEQYIKRHSRKCAQLHFNLCKEIGVKLDKEHWYDHVSKSVEASQRVRLPHY